MQSQYGWADLKPHTHYNKLEPSRVYAARTKADDAYRKFDAYVDHCLATGVFDTEKIDELYQEYVQLDDHYHRIKHAYLADPHPEDWFSAPTPVVMPQEVTQ